MLATASVSWSKYSSNNIVQFVKRQPKIRLKTLSPLLRITVDLNCPLTQPTVKYHMSRVISLCMKRYNQPRAMMATCMCLTKGSLLLMKTSQCSTDFTIYYRASLIYAYCIVFWCPQGLIVVVVIFSFSHQL